MADTDPKIVWVGTGEHTSSRSTYWGDGVYKSVDAGKTWTNMGLKDSHHIGRIVIDPKDPNIVYVAALGHLYSPNDERGVYKTIDGGKTWTKSLEVKADGRMVGAADLVMDPKNPKILYAAAYDKERLPWTFNLAGPGSGIYKTIDAGKTWTKLGGGLPGGMLGRIGLDVYAKNPLIVYANIENANKPGMSDADRLKELREGKSSDGMIGEEVYRSDDGGKTWKKVSPDKQKIGGGPGYYYMQIRVDPNDANHVYVLTVGVTHSTDGGKTWSLAVPLRRRQPRAVDRPGELEAHDPRLRPRHGHHLRRRQELVPPRRTAARAVLRRRLRHACGPTTSPAACRTTARCAGRARKRGGGRIVFEDWQTVGGGDGFYNVFDTVTNRYLYNESQFGSLHARRPLHRRDQEHRVARPGAALQLERADPRLAARQQRRLPRAPTSC